MPFKILFFNRAFYPELSATGQLLTELCEDLVRDYNCRVSVVCGRPLITQEQPGKNNFGFGLFRQESCNGIDVLRVRNTNFPTRSFLKRALNYLSYFFLSLLAVLKLGKPDLVVTLTDPPIVVLSGLWAAFRFKAPLVISVRDIFPEAAQGLDGASNPVFNFILSHINGFCFHKAKALIALGNLMRQRLIEKYVSQDKISIIPDWADCRNIYPLPKVNPFSLSLKLTDYFVVMYSGNIGAASGLEVLINSARLLGDYPQIIFVLIGEGIMKPRLMERCRQNNLKNVRFLTYQPREKMSYSLSSADIFVIPLKRNLSGFMLPSKVYTVLASGRPYVACVEKESDIAQMTRDFNCGLLAEPERDDDLAEKILWLYKNKEIRQKMGENARNLALGFDRAAGVKKYYGLLRALLADKKGF